MLVTPHILAGAALGSLMPGSAVGKVAAFFVGWGSHYLLDMVPHWERLFGPHYNDKLPKDHDKWPRHILVQGAMDVFIGLLLLRFFAFTMYTGEAWVVFWGGVGGALPDFLDNTPFWSRITRRIPFWRATERFHRFIHISVVEQRRFPKFTGIITQLVTCSIAVFVLIKR